MIVFFANGGGALSVLKKGRRMYEVCKVQRCSCTVSEPQSVEEGFGNYTHWREGSGWGEIRPLKLPGPSYMLYKRAGMT